MRRAIVCLLVLSFLLCGCAQKEELVIFHAGSLSKPLADVSKAFDDYMAKKGIEVKVMREASGSVDAVRKVTDLHRHADIVAVADYSLIPKMMMPKYADFCIGFATNEVVLVYTNSSKYANEINSTNWFKILARKDVKFGFSNPNRDPCGYRALMVMKLADGYYHKPVFERLVENNTNIRVKGEVIYVPPEIRTNGKIVIRPKETDLLGLLESHSIDYAFEYRSLAMQQHLPFVELPKEINLGSPNESYNVTVFLEFKNKSIKAKPIVYGVTIPKNAEHRKLAIEFLKFLLTEGKGIFEKDYQKFLPKPIVIGKIPVELESVIR